MYIRCIRFALLAALVGVTSTGCKKSPPPAPPAEETVARLHWLGRQRLAAETNAAYFMGVWNLPQSLKLETQTLDKLSLAPWWLASGDGAATNAASALLRPLLDDLIQEESYLEVRSGTHQPGELVLAIRLGEARAGLWETNLAAVFESLTGIRPVAAPGNRRGWSLKKQDASNFVELARAGEWTVVGLALKPNALFADLLGRIQNNHVPFAARTTNFWLEADFDLRRVVQALSLGWQLPADLSQASLTVIGDGTNVLTRGKLNFTGPQAFAPEAWNIPTQLIRDPLISFTAIRGIKSWLSPLKMWNELQLGGVPNQFFFWGLQGMPTQTYFAAPLPDGSNQLHAVTELIMRKANPWLATNAMGSFARAPGFDGVVWTGAPFMSPFLKTVVAGERNFAFGGLSPSPLTNRPPPAELLKEVLGRTNLVCYDWELTGPRIESWTYTGQLLRLTLHKAQLPRASAGIEWLKAVAPKLGNCITVVTKTGPDELSLVRKSSAGFTAVELHGLADWLESPQFPRGSHTRLAPPPPPPAPQSSH